MACILNLETATKNCSVSLAINGKTIAVKEMAEEGFSHSERLHVSIEIVLKEAGITFKDLNAVAVSQGPGSYTGLRIGVSAAKGLCFALDIPLLAIDTLQILASQVNVAHGFIVPMLDARRMEVYSAVFNANFEKTRAVAAEIITETSFSEYNEPLYFVGDSTPKCLPFLTKSNFHFLENKIYPSAKEMSSLSFIKYTNKEFENVAYFEPYYLKDFMITKPKVS